MLPHKNIIKIAKLVVLSLTQQLYFIKFVLPFSVFGFMTLAGCKKNNVHSAGESNKTPEVHQPVPKILHPELPGRPLEHAMNAAQKEFWDYLEQFNRLPDNPTDEMRSMFEVKGVAPDFIYLNTSQNTVFGNVEGAKAHATVFAERYPWVKSLLHKYDISLEVDAKLFSGTTEEILKKYEHYTRYKLRRSNRSLYTKQWLECLLILDYVYAHGSMEDRKNGFPLIDYILNPPVTKYITMEGLVETGNDMEVPAARDIVMALYDDFPELVKEYTCSYPSMIFDYCNNQVEFLNYVKWALRVETFKKWENNTKLDQVHVGNSCVRKGLKSYTIYWYHCHKDVRPNKGWADLAIIEIFKGLYGQNHNQEYTKYKKLLDVAYPPK